MYWEILKSFGTEKRQYFKYREVLARFPDTDRYRISKVLASMVEAGMLSKACEGLYCIVPLDVDPEEFLPDGRLVAKCLLNGKGYYLAYASALYLHGLADEPGPRIMIVSDRQVRPSIRNIHGAEIQFIYHQFNKFFGYEEFWITRQEKAMASDMEKSIVDALTRPQLCGGIHEVLRAIKRSVPRIDHPRLFYYLARNCCQAAVKRFLFLSELLGLEWTEDHQRIFNRIGLSLSLLDPGEPDTGSISSRFGLRINIKVKELRRTASDW